MCTGRAIGPTHAQQHRVRWCPGPAAGWRRHVKRVLADAGSRDALTRRLAHEALV